MPEVGPATVLDTAQQTYTLEEAEQFDDAFRLDRNHAGEFGTRDRAEKTVHACLQRAESAFQRRKSTWLRLDKLWRLHSLSPNAEAMQVHLGGMFEAVETYAVKMKEAIFGVHGYIQGVPEEYSSDPKRAALVAKLIQHQLDAELRLPLTAIPDFRDTAIFGTKVEKLIPDRKIHRTIERSVTAVSMPDGATRYNFSDPEEKERVSTRYERLGVHLLDFRIEETSDSIQDAGWCGDYNYPTEQEVNDLVTRGDYDREAVAQFNAIRSDMAGLKDEAHLHQQGVLRRTGRQQPIGASPDAGPHVYQFARFEWWGDFQIKSDGPFVPCVITTLYPAENQQPLLSVPHGRGVVVRVSRNPYYHQKKPYLYLPCIKRAGEFYGMGVGEVTSRHSHLEDELATAALMAAQLGASPPLMVDERAGLSTEDIPGFLPGATLTPDNLEGLAFLQVPRTAQEALLAAQWFENKGKRVAGFGEQMTAPRVAAAGVVKTAQEEDLHLIKYVDAWETCFIVPCAQMVHGLNKQFMTEERKIQILGAAGIEAPDIRTVRPDDIAVDLRFEATASRKLVQKAFQNQQLLNLLDRGVAMNVQRAMMGQPPVIDEVELMKVVFADGYGIRAFERILIPSADPRSLRTFSQEHVLFVKGERPGVQRGENTIMHLQGHILFVQAGGTAAWRPEDRQAFMDHVYDTLEEFQRQFESSMPGVQQMVQGITAEMGQYGGPTNRSSGRSGGKGPQGALPGGAGPSTGSPFTMPGGGQGQGSPIFRNPMGAGGSAIQGASMSAAPNMGAA